MFASKSTFIRNIRNIKLQSRNNNNQKKQWNNRQFSSDSFTTQISKYSNIKTNKFLSFALGGISAISYLLWKSKNDLCLAATNEDEETLKELENLYRKFSKNGQNDVADFYLALLYLKGTNEFKRNPQKAVELFIRSFKNGIPEAALNLGVLYIEGKDIKKDIKKGIYYLEEADKLGLADASRNLAHLYYTGKEVKENIEKARFYYKKAADSGDPDSQHIYGILCHLGRGGPRDLDQAVKYYKLAAENGISDAQYNLALFYHRGIGVTKDIKKAHFWYERAAEQEDGDAQYQLSKIYREENEYKNSKSSLENALYWLEKASKNNNVLGQREYGAYLKSQGKLEDAYTLFSKCSKEGNDDCKIEQALMILDGKGVPPDQSKNEKLAFYYIKDAADNGSPFAQTKLATMYLLGVGTRKDLKMALYYFESAAKNNDIDALFHLGMMYEQGYGVQQSSAKAREYLQKAADLGHKIAYSYLNNPEHDLKNPELNLHQTN